MENLYNTEDARQFIQQCSAYSRELALRVYTSRLIGKNRDLVLHGGGNTSVKCRIKNILDEEIDVLFVKGSGWDLATMEPEGFAGLMLDPIRKLRRLDSLSDEAMENQLAINRIESRSPNPSVEALLHAFLPHKYIDHTHADSILILTNQKQGKAFVEEALGSRVTIIPYEMSGFPLAKAVAEAYEDAPDADAVVVMHHGIFTFSEEAKTAYDNMIRFVTRAEKFIAEKIRTSPIGVQDAGMDKEGGSESDIVRVAPVLRGAVSRPAPDGRLRRFYIEARTSPDLVKASLSPEAREICRSGVLTPDHAIRTKHQMVFIDHVPELDDDLKDLVNMAIDAFKTDFKRYCRNQADLNPYPILFLVSGVGMIALGETRKAARVSADIGEHTIRAKLLANALGGYKPIAESHVFDMECWNLQQKKLGKDMKPLQGQVAIITGGAGAIGYGIAKQVLAAGAVVVISDIDGSRLNRVHHLLAEAFGEDRVEAMVMDVTDLDSVESAFKEICRRLGGIDIVVPNAGIAHVAKLEDLKPEKFDQVISVNLKGTYTVIKGAIPIFRRQGTGGNIVVISSKNVFDPGAAFGAYSASKAGAHQISKIAALELAELGVRVNMVNPDAVFGDDTIGSKLWEEVGPDRMKSRGLDAQGLKDYYRQRSLLKVQVSGEHVGNAVVFFASELTPTTGASLPVDAGNPAAFPR
ncbi:MAG TPA: bifunctional aldolase/short-chain dehydrogenase [Deltaproteobacteria bacterium]|nr:bifunctional aldolase/short-chain dehydrogenase [Deltaproteobacteria bacterium]